MIKKGGGGSLREFNRTYAMMLNLVDKMSLSLTDTALRLQLREALAITYYEVGSSVKSQRTLQACIHEDISFSNGKNLYSMVYAARCCGLSDDEIRSLLRGIRSRGQQEIIEKVDECLARLNEYKRRHHRMNSSSGRKPALADDPLSIEYIKRLIENRNFSRLDVILYGALLGGKKICVHRRAKLLGTVVAELQKAGAAPKAASYEKELIKCVLSDDATHCEPLDTHHVQCRYYHEVMGSLVDNHAVEEGLGSQLIKLLTHWSQHADDMMADHASYLIARYIGKDYDAALEILGLVQHDEASFYAGLDPFIQHHYEHGEVEKLIEFLDKIGSTERKIWSLATEILNFEQSYQQRMCHAFNRLSGYVESTLLSA
jgi:hypothetical protein